MFTQDSIRTTLSRNIVLVTLLAVGVQAAVFCWFEFAEFRDDVAQLREEHFETHRQRVQSQVESAVGYVRYELERVKKRARDERSAESSSDIAALEAEAAAVAKPRIFAFLGQLRFGQGDILFGNDWSEPGKVICLMGAFPYGFDVLTGPAPVAELQPRLEAVASAGGGFIEYRFADSADRAEALKLSYVGPMILPERWFIGGGVYVPTIEAELAARRDRLWGVLGRQLFASLLLLSIALAVILRVAESAGVRVENTTKRFQLFFARAATEAVTLEPEGLDFAEFRPLVDAANSMVTQRNVAETELREKEDQLRQSQKLEAVGQLAGGVAHDFNNVLTGIMGNASLLQINCAPDSEGAGYVSAILTASERAAALTRQLLDFSRKGRVRDVDTDLHALIADVEALLGRSLDPRVVISTRLEATSSVVRGDPAQLQNALLNLAINARDAMPDGGELVFATRDLQISPDGSGRGAFRDHILAAGHYVEVVVSDTGSGMDSEVLGRLFEPFFTTKAPGKGTGLGLAGVYGCVRSHAGVIRVESEPGQGTRFELLFPLAKRVASGTPTAPLSFPEATASGVGATVLVVDDEEMVRTLAVLALKKDGYEIVEAEDGLGAVAAVEAPAHLDLLLLDLIMPGLSGEQTLARVRALRPDLPVLVASGFSEPQTMQRVLTLDGVRGFLAKPYTVDELRRAVVLALAEPSPTE